MTKLSRNALKDRIKNLSKEQRTTFQNIQKTLFLERFLVRLTNSPMNQGFVFKGGNLLNHYIPIGRQTTDLDFLLTKIKSEEGAVQKAFEQICEVKIDDGFELQYSSIEDLEHNHMAFPGFRVSMSVVHLDSKMKDNIQVDIGVGDKVDPVSKEIELLKYGEKPFFEKSIQVQAYPPETIFAEKLHAVTVLGGTNSRMKDYHDLYLMSRSAGLIDTKVLGPIILDVFQNRGGSVAVPIAFDQSDVNRLSQRWTTHGSTVSVASMQKLGIPADFPTTLKGINEFLGSVPLKKK